MDKTKLSELLGEYGGFLKRFGIYLVIILLVFGVSITYMLGNTQDKPRNGYDDLERKQVKENTQEAEQNTVPTDKEDISLSTSTVKKADTTEPKEAKPEATKPKVTKPEVTKSEEIKSKETSVAKTKTDSKVIKTGDLQNITGDTAQKEDKVQTSTPIVEDISQIPWPGQGEVLKRYGMKYSETFGDYRFHPGIDIKLETGTQVQTVLAGKIISIEDSKAKNITVEIDHGNGWFTRYSHLSKALLKQGQTVKAGELIGVVGQPGLAESMEGPHLHFELKQTIETVNPLDYLKN